MRHPPPQLSEAFTLLELLVTVAIVVILAGLSLATIGNSQRLARRTACQTNLRQIVLGCLMYASDCASGSLTPDSRAAPGIRLDEDDDLSRLFPVWLPETRVFTCPGTRNYLRPTTVRDPWSGEQFQADLAELALSPRGPGTSYECFGVMAWTVRKTAENVASYQHRGTEFELNGQIPGPSRIFLVVDAQPGKNHGRSANHSLAGANSGFCDGHVTWERIDHWPFDYEWSQDESGTAADGPE